MTSVFNYSSGNKLSTVANDAQPFLRQPLTTSLAD